MFYNLNVLFINKLYFKIVDKQIYVLKMIKVNSDI